MKIYKMLVWKYTGTCGLSHVEEAYQWLMQAPVWKRPLRLWCIKHRYASYYKDVYSWISNELTP